MSSTTGDVISQEHYPTPVNLVKALVNQMVIKPTDKFLEPCRADGNIYNQIELPDDQKSWSELRDGVDYLTTIFPPQDIIITNPPFSLTCEFLTKSLHELKPDGTLAYLQRVNFLGTVKRLPFWESSGYPDKLPVCVPRPHFVKGSKGDSCEYAWFIYDRGNRFPFINKGVGALEWDKVKL
jgi:hypothetical protein